MDLFVVPTLSFRLLYGLLILSHGWRQILRLAVATAALVVIEDKLWNRLRWNIRFSSGK